MRIGMRESEARGLVEDTLRIAGLLDVSALTLFGGKSLEIIVHETARGKY